METNHIILLLLIFLTHWISDFVTQGSYIAQNKSKNNGILLQHVAIYGIVFFVCLMMISFIYGPNLPLNIDNIFKFCVINSAIHFVVDYITSRLSSKVWREERIHDFFVIIGFDQFIHIVTLLITTNVYLILV